MPRRSLSHEHGYSLIEILVVVGMVAVLAAVTVPVASTSLTSYRFEGDGQAMSHMVGLAKMRAAARSTRARMYVDIEERSFALQTFDRAALTWVTDGGVQYLSTGVTFSNGDLDSPPPNQDTVNFSAECKDDGGSDIDGTACISFNSRGLPVDGNGLLEEEHAIYLTNGIGVYAVTVMPTGQVRFYWSPARGAGWTERQ
jgi:prepilin-type N-terminal cleavage/methylation domain-containing protein